MQRIDRTIASLSVSLIRRCSRGYAYKLLCDNLDAKVIWNNLSKLGLTCDKENNADFFTHPDFNFFFLTNQSTISASYTSSNNIGSFAFSNVSTFQVLFNAINDIS